jgi:hypothetical protein
MDDAHHLNGWLADRNYQEEGGTRVMSSILIAGASPTGEFALPLAERGTPGLAVARNGESPRTDTAPNPSEPAVR